MATARDILRRELDGLEEAVELAPFSAYGVGGPAEFFYRATSTGALVHAVVVARRQQIPLTILGLGTNVLIHDDGLEGLVVLVRSHAYTLDGELLRAEAGVELPALVGELVERGLAGLEFAGNIPGSVGGAIVGNAGAYGRSISESLVEVHFLDGVTEHVMAPDRLEFAYRTSIFKTHPELVVLSGAFRLRPGDREALRAKLTADHDLRHIKHPLDLGSCGSFFKNPSRELPAAKLIEAAGLKGLTVGHAQVSPKHANFLVALPGARAADIDRLSAEVVERVFDDSGQRLEEEVRRLGF